MAALTSSRTTSPKRRRRSSASTASSRSSASSETSKSASRVTRKTPLSTTSMPGKSASRLAAMTSSSGTKVRLSSPTGTKRGRISVGTLTRAKVVSPICGSRTSTASDSERLEMYGNGRPDADGQRREHGEHLAAEALVERLALLGVDLVDADDADAVLGQRGAQVALDAACLAVGQLDDPLAELVDDLRRRAPVGARVAEAGVDLVVQAGDADHEELVEVRREDGRELQSLHERLLVLLGELEHARVELDPRQLAVVVERGIVEVGGRRRELGLGRRDGADRLLLGHRVMSRVRRAAPARPLPSDEWVVNAAGRSRAAYSRRARNPSRSSPIHSSRKRPNSRSRRACR